MALGLALVLAMLFLVGAFGWDQRYKSEVTTLVLVFGLVQAKVLCSV